MALAEDGTAASITRGPYLQQGTPGSVVVRWRTDVAADSAVGYGTAPGSFPNTLNNFAAVTEHIVSITNLNPLTKYYYQIGTTTAWFGGSTNNYFITAPPVGPARPVRIWALGDCGTGTTDAAAARDSYTVYNGTRRTDVWLMLGDNAYSSGTDAEFQANLFNFYPTYLQNNVLWPAIGNHEAQTAQAGAYLAAFTLPQNAEAGGLASGTPRYYSFDYANIHFVCLDTATSDRGTNGAMLNWLRADLEATAQEWIIAYWHHPPYTKGTHDSDLESNLVEVRQNIIPLMEHYGVDLVLCGHSHGYERSYCLDGHYGSSSTFTESMKKIPGDGREDGTGAYQKSGGINAHEGTVYTVAGSSGHAGGGSYNHPAMFLSLGLVGSVVVDVVSNRLDLAFIKTDATTGDHFTILKSAVVATNTPLAPTGLIATAISTSQINLAWTDRGTDEQGYKLERSTNGLDFAQFTIVGAGVTNGADTGLAAGKIYYYRVRAYNAAGDSPFSNIAQATTLAAPAGDTTAPAAVTNLLVTGASLTSVSLSWTAPGDDGNTGTATSYDLRYSTNFATLTNWTAATPVVGEPVPLLAGTSQSMTITGLVSGRAYFFALKTTDETNNLSPLSNVASTNTPVIVLADTTPPSAVTNLLVLSATTNSATLSWAAPGDDGSTGTATGYDLRYSTNLATLTNWTSAAAVAGEPAPAIAGTVQSMTVTGLLSGRTYFFALKTSDEATNVSLLSNVATTNVPAIPGGDIIAPAAITNLVSTGATTNSATLSWTAPGDDGNTGTATAYDLRYSTNLTTLTNWTAATVVAGEPAPAIAGTVQSMTVPGLLPGRAYFFAIKTSDEATNVSLLSNVATTNVPAIPGGDIIAPAAITNLAITGATTGSVSLAWTAPGDDGSTGTATSYDLRYSTNFTTLTNWTAATTVTNEPVPLAAGTAQSLTVSGLAAGVTYYFALKTTDETNNLSPISNVPAATTLLPLGTNSSVAFLIPSNSVWKYLDNGSNQSNAWTALNFNDSGWLSGPALIGYGGGSVTVVSYGSSTNARYITTYFRSHFTVGDPSVFNALRVGLQRDDGAAVFLNGTEIFRDNLPTNVINYLTLASSNVSGPDQYTYFPSAPISPALLVTGDNVVAVEMHQYSANSSDMHLNLELRAFMMPPVARINLVAGGQCALRWASFPGKHYQVQTANNFAPAVWTALGANVTAPGYSCSVTNATGGQQQRFYRVLLLD